MKPFVSPLSQSGGCHVQTDSLVPSPRQTSALDTNTEVGPLDSFRSDSYADLNVLPSHSERSRPLSTPFSRVERLLRSLTGASLSFSSSFAFCFQPLLTRILSSSRLSTIVQHDLIIIMAEGQIVEQGTHKELLEKNGCGPSSFLSHPRSTCTDRYCLFLQSLRADVAEADRVRGGEEGGRGRVGGKAHRLIDPEDLGFTHARPNL